MAAKSVPKQPSGDFVAFVLKRKAQSLEQALRLVMDLQEEISTLNILQELSIGTKAEFGCGMDHVRQGYDEMRDCLLALLMDA